MAKSPQSEGQQGGYQDFTLVSKYPFGYRNREDRTVLPPGVLVSGSQNVLTNTFQHIGIRKGYTLDGQANAALAPIGGQNGAMGVFDWNPSSGGERNMRAGFLTVAGNDGKLQFRYEHVDGTIEWIDLLTGLSSIDFNFITFWDEDSLEVLCLMVNGESNIRSWNGAVTSVSSATNTAGIIGTLYLPGDLSQILVTGGIGYTLGDVLTITGGGGNATATVTAVTTGGLNNVTINAAGSGYAVGNQFSIAGGTGGQFAAIGQVATIGGSGEVLTFTLLGRGKGYSTATGVSTTHLSGTGTGLTLDIVSVSGGVISAWDFVSDANHGTGYTVDTSYSTTGGTGSGARVRTSLVVSGTIVKSGTQTWAEAGFTFGNGAFQTAVVINGTTYEYYSDAFIGDTTTLYGITPDPSAIPADSVIVEAVVTWDNTGGTDGIPTEFHNDLIGTLNARVFVASKSDALVYLSDYTSFKTYILASTFILTNAPTCMIPQEEALYISAGRDEWYKTNFQISSDLTTVGTSIARLNTTVQQAAQTQAATTKIANSVAFISFEPVLETFGPVENVFLGPQMSDLSFPVVNDFNNYDLTNASPFYFRKFIYIAVPREGLVLVYNMSDPNNPYWEAPQVLPISRFSVINGDLYGHSSQVSETYKLFDGTNDNGYPIAAKANFSFNNYGTRSQSKGYNEFYTEGYISANTDLTLGIQFDIDGCATITSFEINGDDAQIVCIPSDSASLGKSPLGKNPLGGTVGEPVTTPKFRVIKTFPLRYFYEDQISFSSEGLDDQWEIVAFGPQLQAFTDLNNAITQ